MEPIAVHVGIAAPLLRANVDTDAIIPSREMRRVSRKGLSDGLFANWRYLEVEPRCPNPDFVLNHPGRAGTSILLCGSNFGCGSSREYAVWALDEFGIRVIVAPSFGPIFQKNCVANGLLPARLPFPAICEFAAWTDRDPQGNRLTVDLRAAHITGGGTPVPFDVSRGDRARLLRGLDDIDLTDIRASAVDAFERKRFAAHPWVRMTDDPSR